MAARGFEVISKYAGAGINLPQRSTMQAAGYDFEAAEDIVVPARGLQESQKPVLVPTGIKAYMQEGEYLQLVCRSSGPIKKKLIMSNGVGIIDGDYYNNEKNEGHIFFQFLNFGDEDLQIKKGDRIGQGLFLPFLLADQDGDAIKTVRSGGFGSTGEA
ncbi:dUTP diphosphatase [Fructobacillus sp. M1-13]|uniref:dUTP diphosphatase n=1 Tax=Fructobacillus papyriferae TaxID=2713171 RepID=A0ABS5QQQ7_9LACO|nr:dUTP diphosphatase [Fructobacillus papyriferae]MBS9335514.1 dUTP diphosphatase [Fructobacillus papyriferae]MCD2159284.1 dUTP diphosphatase [Fructobacillus papyriferae]